MKVQKGGGDNRVCEPGLVRVRCTAVVPEDKPDDAYGKTKKFRLTFKATELTGDDNELLEFERVVNRAFHQKSNLYAIFQGFGLPVDDEVYEPDTDDLLGREANALIVDYTSESDGSQWSRVDKILPLPKAQRGTGGPVTARQASVPTDLEDGQGAAALSDWWSETRRQGIPRKDVIETSQALFDGKEPADLDYTQRAHLMEQLLLGV